MIYSRFKSICSSARVVVAVLVAMLMGVGCSDYDESFGLEYVPSSQELVLKKLENNTCFTTSLFLSDSIRSSNIGLVVLGVEKDMAFGERRAGFFTQFIPTGELNPDDDDDWSEKYPFGYEPTLDSLMFMFTVLDYSGDTTLVQQFEVYEALNVDFLEDSKDSVYFDNFDVSNLNLTSEPIFTFTFPDYDNEIYLNSSYVRLYPTGNTASQAFIDRLMLEDDDADNDIYDSDYRELFLEKFNGLYIKSVTTLTEEPTDPLEPKGAIYSMYVDGSGIGFYARSRYQEDPTIIKDTVTMTFAFRSLSSYTLDEDYYGISINTMERESDLLLNLDTPSPTIRVEGMGGVVSKITITEELFEQLDSVLTATKDSNGDDFNTIFMNLARLSIYVLPEADGNYDNTLIDPFVITPWLDEMPSRLGLYSSYVDYYETEDDYDDDDSMLTGIEDYYYEYELAYGVVLPFGGYLNRGSGCYQMTISSQLQAAWNSYLEAKEEAGGDVSLIDWDSIEERSFIIAPVADNLYTVDYASMQGMPDVINNAPLKLDLTYTLVK